MATSRNILCAICEAQHITKHADQWCPECDQGLCSDCATYHNISKASRNHGVISIENYHKLPLSISEIGYHCEHHDMKYTLFCQSHDKPCCPDCVSTNHKDCVGLLSIREKIKTSKTSTLIDNIEQNLTDIKNNIDNITENRQHNLSEILQQRQIFQDQIKQMRVKINSHLDTLEQNILQELDDTEDRIKSKLDKLLEQLSKNSKAVEGLQSDIIAVKECASDLQALLGSKILAEEVQKEEEYLMALLSDDGYLQQLNLRYTINTKIKDILSTITTFGSVSIETSPPSVAIKTMKAEQAQSVFVIQHPSAKSINDSKFTLHTSFNIPKGKGKGSIAITGCIVCPNGKMIVVDHGNKRLVTLNEDGTLDKEISCSPGYPFNIICLDDKTVAVSTNIGIEIINIDSAKTERFIKTSEPCRGITHHNGVLLWCEYQRGIQMMQLSDDKITTLVKQINLTYDTYIATCGDKIYFTNRSANTVTCYTIKGEKLWEYKDVSVLNDPRGVSVDINDNVYVTSNASHSVVVIEPDGRQGRQLISSDDGLDDPTGIYFNKSKNSLFVTNYRGKAFLYNMC
jgi:DNA-binding beta-propeller fold protein YncE